MTDSQEHAGSEPEAPPRRPRPAMTLALIGVNVAVFVAMVIGGVSIVDPGTSQLIAWGADYGPLSLGGEPWRMLSAAFVHVGLLHVAVNMWALWNIAPLAELIYGPWSLAAIYAICGIAGSALSLWWNPLGPVSAGASGAIFGIGGALISSLWRVTRRGGAHELKGVLTSLVVCLGYNLAFGLAYARINNAAHLGGLLAGLVLGLALARPLAPAQRRAVIAGVAALLAAGVLGLRAHAQYATGVESSQRAYASGRFEDAARDLERVVAAQPDLVWAQARLAAAWLAAKKYEPAEAAAKRALALAPKDPLAREVLGDVYLDTGRADDAVRVLSELLRDQPGAASARVNLADALASTGRLEDASATLNEGLRLDPSSAQLHLALGIVEGRRGRLAESHAELRKAAGLGSKPAEKLLKRLEGGKDF